MAAAAPSTAPTAPTAPTPEKARMLPLPLFKCLTGGRFKFPAFFNGVSVIISDPAAVKNLNNCGFFGRRVIQTVRVREDNAASTSRQNPVIEKEFLYLLLEEALFLLSLNCIELTDMTRSTLTAVKAWNLFCQGNVLFLQNYIIYRFYRAKNWIVKAGLKFGGDFLLYKQCPENCHSTFVVLVDIGQSCKSNDRRLKRRRALTAPELFGISRLAQTCRKQLVIARIIWADGIQLNLTDPSCVKNFQIQEISVNRICPLLEKRTENPKV